MLALFLQELRARRGAIIGWTLGLGLYAFFSLSIFPEIGLEFADLELPEFYDYLGDFSDIGTVQGFFDAQFLAYLPLLLGIFVIGAGTRTLAGEEDDGTLEMLVTLPIPRWQVVVG